MSEACKKFDTPVTGGNVSFYNQSPIGPVYPTPTIGMVGLLDDLNDKMTLDFKNAGDIIYSYWQKQNDINCSVNICIKYEGVEFSPAPILILMKNFSYKNLLASL